MCRLLSMSACAAAASAIGNTLKTGGAQRPASSSGHTFSRSAAAISPFCAVVRGRMVLPVTVNVARSPEEAERQARGEEIAREEEPTLEDELRAELGAAVE